MSKSIFSLMMSIFLSVSLAQGWIIAESFNDRVWLVFSIFFGGTILSLIWAISKVTFDKFDIKLIMVITIFLLAFSPFMLDKAISNINPLGVSVGTGIFWSMNYFYLINLITTLFIFLFAWKSEKNSEDLFTCIPGVISGVLNLVSIIMMWVIQAGGIK